MKRGLLVVVLLAAVCSLASLQLNSSLCIETWEVTGRAFVPAHYETWVSIQCNYYNPNGVCQVWTPLEHKDFYPDSWELIWKDCKHEFRRTAASKQMYEETPRGTRTIHRQRRWGRKCPCE